MKRMKLITKELEQKLPRRYAQESLGGNAVAYVKLFTPDSNWTWYVTEYDPEDRELFGLVVGQFTELGYFSLDELEQVRGPLGLPIERDTSFTPTKLRDLPETPQWLRETEEM